VRADRRGAIRLVLGLPASIRGATRGAASADHDGAGTEHRIRFLPS
jgi:hypothetical protein